MRAGAARHSPPCLRRSARLPMLPASGSRPRLAAPLATQAWRPEGAPERRGFRTDGQTAGWQAGRSPGLAGTQEEGRPGGRGGERRGRGEEGELVLSPPLGPLS